MKNRIKTAGLLAVVGFLLITTIYISFLLRNESESAPTTIRKTKAAAQTYSRLITLNVPTINPVFQEESNPDLSPTEALSPSPEGKYIADARSTVLSGTPAPTESVTPTSADLSSTPTPTSLLLAQNQTTPTESLTPTEVLLAKVTSTPTVEASVSATTVKTKALPDAGWIKPLHLMFLFAFSLIFFSLIY